MDIQCDVKSIYCEPKPDGSSVYVEMTVDSIEANEIFDQIKHHVSANYVLSWLDDTDIRNYIREIDNG